jgi:hypothetical protein
MQIAAREEQLKPRAFHTVNVEKHSVPSLSTEDGREIGAIPVQREKAKLSIRYKCDPRSKVKVDNYAHK